MLHFIYNEVNVLSIITIQLEYGGAPDRAVKVHFHELDNYMKQQ